MISVVLFALIAISAAQQVCPDGTDVTKAKIACGNGTFDPNTCRCTVSSSPTCPNNADYATAKKNCDARSGRFNADTCDCLVDTTQPQCPDGVNYTNAKADCDKLQGAFDGATCRCTSTTTAPKCPDGSDYTAAKNGCVQRQGNFNGNTCECTTIATSKCPTGVDPTAARAECDKRQGAFNPDTCECTTTTAAKCPTGVDAASARAECDKRNGAFDSASCECIVTACKPAPGLAEACTRAGGKLDANCQCTVTLCPGPDFVSYADAKKDCINRGGVINAECKCDVSGTCPGSTASVADSRARCMTTQGIFIPDTCECKPQTSCLPSAELQSACEKNNGKVDPATCACSVRLCPNLSSYEQAKAECSKRGGVINEKCECIETACLVSAEYAAACKAAQGTVTDTCKCTELLCPQTLKPYASAKADCASRGGIIDGACNCNICTDADYAKIKLDCSQREAPLGQRYVADANTCTCRAVCAANGIAPDVQALRCAAARQTFNKEKCVCEGTVVEPQPCDATVAKDCPLTGYRFFADTCRCEQVCPDGTRYADAKSKCINSGLVFGGPADCKCSDICSARNIDATVARTACKAKNGVFDERTCQCLTAPDCSNVAECKGKVDPTTCACIVDKPCDITPELGAALVVSCGNDGTTNFFQDTCACERICPRDSEFAGVRLTDAQRKCNAAGGKFDANKCVCITPDVKVCEMIAPCPPNYVVDRATCRCVEACPTGQPYATAKAACVGNAESSNTFDPATCRCTPSCTGELRTKWETHCKSVNLPFDADNCQCKEPEKSCDPSTAEYAKNKELCIIIRGLQFDPATCRCIEPEVPPIKCEDGSASYDEAKRACITSGGEFFPEKCACVPRCLARNADFAAKCSPDQKSDGCGGCIDECTSDSRRYAVAKEECYKTGGLFDPATCGCVRKCDLNTDATAAAYKKCVSEQGRFDRNTCSCQPQVEVCTPEAFAANKKACAARGWAFDEMKCLCKPKDDKVIVVTFKADLTDADIENAKQRIALLLKTCDIDISNYDVKSDGANHKVVVKVQSVGENAGACPVQLDDVKATLAKYQEAADVQIEELTLRADVPTVVDDKLGMPANTLLLSSSVAAIVAVVSLA